MFCKMVIKGIFGTGGIKMDDEVRQNWLYWKGALDVEPILNYASQASKTEATTFGGDSKSHRRSEVAWLTGNEQIVNTIWAFMEEAHKSFRVQILRQKTEIQYTEYHATNRGKYDWHHDVDWNNPSGLDRKLSVTVQLSDPSEYEGGDFQFMEVEQPSEEAKTKGTVLMFPSYLQHRVTPVTDGVRKSLVLWFTGPRWQ